MINGANVSEYRFERKFFVTELSRHEVESIVKLNSAVFSEIFYERIVNNIYFDTYNMKNLCDNLEGASDRVKVRIRWYDELIGHIKKPVLELKIKNGLLGKKISVPLKAFNLNADLKIQDIFKSNICLLESDLNGLLGLNPVLINKYSRKYFESRDKKFRITLDFDQHFFQVSKTGNLLLEKYNDAVSVILEIKYNKEFDNEANRITSQFPFRITKSSKYVNGLSKIFQSNF